MPEDLREEILNKIFDPVSEDCRTRSEDLQLAITLDPSLDKIKLAQDEYADARMKQLLQYLAENKVSSEMIGAKGHELPLHKYKNNYIGSEELFNNFL